MGNMKQMLSEGGFSSYLYNDHPNYAPVTINGITAKVVYKIDDPTKAQAGLPTYANKSDMYFKQGIEGNIIQAKLYDGRQQKLDFDWGHRHKNDDGTIFPKGVVHVQEYGKIEGGRMPRFSCNARLMTDAEIKKYGPLILHYNPNAKFR